MKLLVIVFLCFTFNCLSQVVDTTNTSRHYLEFYPVSLTLNKNFNFGHALKYSYQLNKHFYVQGMTDGVISEKLNGRSWKIGNGFPLLNQSTLIIERQFQFNNSSNLRHSNVGVQFGCHYLQFGSVGDDYWVIDTTTSGERVYLTGFKSNSFKIGLKYQIEKQKVLNGNTLLKWSHSISTDFLFSFRYRLISFNELNEQKTSIENTYPLNRKGIRANYTFKHSLSKKAGLAYSVEGTWAPFIEYAPSYYKYVPRGDEYIRPLFINIKVGLFFH